MAEPSQYREPLKSSLPRNFREPIMSSTQKSVDINPFVTDSHDLFRIVPPNRLILMHTLATRGLILIFNIYN
jgi:hypothetical protein